ncbi:hypothetical protein GQ54DRAFT_318330 [Martensiomyces pterosporus]|nr:hypothetical protein GQ54DRAFT_318330 [Martensiomyces pterosporus]
MKFSTPERVCWDDDATNRTFFVVARPGSTSQWRAKPKTDLDEVVHSHDVFSFRRGSGEMARVASNEDLQQAFKTTDVDSVIKSLLSAGSITAKEFELDVPSQTTNAASAASNAANVAANAAAATAGSAMSYISSFWS